MITVKEVDKSFLELYDKVAMNVNVHLEYDVKRINNGLGGFILEEVQVEPYIKDLSSYERAAAYENEFDITNWRFYIAFNGDIPVGAMTIADKTEGLNMLYGRKMLVYYGIFALPIHINAKELDKNCWIWAFKILKRMDIDK